MDRADELSLAQARRIALVAQGFRDPRHTVPTMRTFARTLGRVGVLQVDSVNVLQRAHYMPLFSRMGGYDTGLLTRAAESRPRRVVEYWAHVQALMPVDLWPVMRHRMAGYRERRGKWSEVVADSGTEEALLEAVRQRGPVTAADLEEEFGNRPTVRENWGWNWSMTRKTLDFLFMVGDLAIAGRTSQFEPRYDLPERVLPAHVVDAPAPTRAEAARELIRRASRSYGVATAGDLADYFRMRLRTGVDGMAAQPAIDDLVDAGELVPVRVEGWSRPAYLHRDHHSGRPRRVAARALLSPFDPVVWLRDRAERLFDFHYRIEIYVPAAKRTYGYYVLPFLLGDRIVGRVDLKAARGDGRLVVQAAYAEEHAPHETAAELAEELRDLAAWLGLDDIEVRRRGDLADAIAEELR